MRFNPVTEWYIANRRVIYYGIPTISGKGGNPSAGKLYTLVRIAQALFPFPCRLLNMIVVKRYKHRTSKVLYMKRRTYNWDKTFDEL